MLMIVPLRPIRHGHLLWSLVTQPKQIVKCGVSLDDDLSPIANLVIVRWSVMLHTLSITSIVSRSSCHVKTEQSPKFVSVCVWWEVSDTGSLGISSSYSYRLITLAPIYGRGLRDDLLSNSVDVRGPRNSRRTLRPNWNKQQVKLPQASSHS